MDPELSAHQHGSSFRDKADAILRQFTTWLALASVGGITLCLKFITDAAHPQLALLALKPSLAAWLIGLMAAASTVYLQYQENGWAGASFHAQGRREKQKARHTDQRSTDDDRSLAKRRAEENQAAADRCHRISRACMRAGQLTMVVTVASFIFGAAYPIWSFNDGRLVGAITKAADPRLN